MHDIRDALMPALLILSAAGVLETIGYALCPAAMQGGAVLTHANHIGWLIARIASAVYDNRGFVLGVCAGYALCGRSAYGALIGLFGALLMNSFCAAPFFLEFAPSVLDSAVDSMALYGPDALSGLLFALLGSFMGRRLSKRHPLISGSLFIASFLGLTTGLIFARILLVRCGVRLGMLLAETGDAGAMGYAVFNRLLAPSELHRPLNAVILSEFGVGDMARYWAAVTDGDPGRYMSGFFPVMMGAVPAVCVLLLRRQNTAGDRLFFLLSAFAAFGCGLCEPFEYWLLLTSPLCYGFYALSYGISEALVLFSGFRAGFACSGGFVDFVFSAPLPAATRSWLILVLAPAMAVLFYIGVYDRFIKKDASFVITKKTEE